MAAGTVPALREPRKPRKRRARKPRKPKRAVRKVVKAAPTVQPAPVMPAATRAARADRRPALHPARAPAARRHPAEARRTEAHAGADLRAAGSGEFDTTGEP